MNFEIESWIAQFGSAIEEPLKQAIIAVTDRLPANDIAGIGVATDADGTSIVVLANSRVHLENMIAEEPEYTLDSRWHLGEWDMDMRQAAGDDPLDSVRTEVARARTIIAAEAGNDEQEGLRQLGAFRLAVWDAISQSMAKIVAEGFFGHWPNAKRVFMPLDADVSERQIAEWNKQLHSVEDHEEFRDFLQLT